MGGVATVNMGNNYPNKPTRKYNFKKTEDRGEDNNDSN